MTSLVQVQNSSATGLARTIQKDFLASIVVFLVALPLCMGVAIASGVPVTAGILSGVIGGVVVGCLAGCPLQVSGPAAGLTVIVVELGERLGLANLSLVVAIAGILQIFAGVTGLGQWFRAVSPAVIRGMLAGIGFLILGGQFHAMFDSKAPGSGAVNLAEIPEAVRSAWRPLVLPAPEERKARIVALNTCRRLATEQTNLRQRARAALEALGARIPTGNEPASVDSAGWKEIAETQSRLAETAARLADQLAGAKIDLGAVVGDAVGATERAARAVANEDPVTATAEIHRSVAAVDMLLASLKSPQFSGLLGLGTIAILILWKELTPRSWRVVPAALVAVLVIAITATCLDLPVYYVDVPESLSGDLTLPTRSVLTNAPWRQVFQGGLLMAVVASAETLLCASAVDQMHRGARTRYDKELWAQGVGNLLCGLVGALPMTGVIVRSSANVQSGARTRLSAILHGIWLLVFVSFLSSLLRQIPTSCLAAILVYTGYRLIDVRSIRELRVFGWDEVAIYAATILTIIFEDLLTGVLVGITLSALKLLHRFSQLQVRLDLDPKGGRAALRLTGAATFIRLPKLAAALERVPPGVELHVDFEKLEYIDHACLELLMTWGARHQETGAGLVLDWETLRARFRRQDQSGQAIKA